MNGWEWLRARQWSAYDAVRVALGALLLVAAGLKAHQLATAPVLGDGILNSRWFHVGVVEFELLFGLWLLAGIFPRQAWAVAIACFLLFAGVSLFKAISGAATCVCFGRVRVSPWFSFLLDASAILALIAFPPYAAQPRSSVSKRSNLARCVATATLWLLTGIPAAIAMGNPRFATLLAGGRIPGDGKMVLLEPEKWVGRRFALLDYLEGASPLAQGRWHILLYHHDCAKCLAVLPRYERLAMAFEQIGDDRIALIEFPPYAPANRLDAMPAGLGVWHARVSARYEWLVETPLEVAIEDGVVAGWRNAAGVASRTD